MATNKLLSTQYVVEDMQDGLIVKVSENEVYYGFPRDKSTTVADPYWKVFRVMKYVIGGATCYIKSHADGNENYDNVFNPNDVSAIQGLTYPVFGITLP